MHKTSIGRFAAHVNRKGGQKPNEGYSVDGTTIRS
jgi:hypothetical protein